MEAVQNKAIRTAACSMQLLDSPQRFWNKPAASAWRQQWSRFVRYCESLARDGYAYEVELTSKDNPEGGRIGLKVRGIAGRAVSKIATPRRKSIAIVAALTVDRCQKELAVAKAEALDGRKWIVAPSRERIPGDRRAGWWHDRKARSRAAGRKMAKRLAQGIAGKRELEYHLNAWKRRLYTHESPKVDPAEHLAARKAALADVEYWREMELLAGQRHAFKPGLTAEVDKVDQEVPVRRRKSPQIAPTVAQAPEVQAEPADRTIVTVTQSAGGRRSWFIFGQPIVPALRGLYSAGFTVDQAVAVCRALGNGMESWGKAQVKTGEGVAAAFTPEQLARLKGLCNQEGKSRAA